MLASEFGGMFLMDQTFTTPIAKPLERATRVCLIGGTTQLESNDYLGRTCPILSRLVAK